MSDDERRTTGYEEHGVFFPYGDLSLSGVLTLSPEGNGRTVLLTWGPSPVSSAGVNRVRARIARALAGHGYHSFRFDYPGIGESQGTYGRPSRTTPLADEVTGIADWLASAGHDRLLILGNCLGGWSALVAAPGISQLEGLFLVNPPVRRDHKQVRAAEEGWRWWAAGLKKVSMSKLRDPAHRAKYRKMLAAKGSAVVGATGNDQRFPHAVRAVLDRGIPLKILFGDDDFRGDFEEALARGLQARFDAGGAGTGVLLVPENLDGQLAELARQDLLIRAVVDWLGELPASATGDQRGDRKLDRAG